MALAMSIGAGHRPIVQTAVIAPATTTRARAGATLSITASLYAPTGPTTERSTAGSTVAPQQTAVPLLIPCHHVPGTN